MNRYLEKKKKRRKYLKYSINTKNIFDSVERSNDLTNLFYYVMRFSGIGYLHVRDEDGTFSHG